MIIPHLTPDTCSLIACSLTCYSRYIATVAHLHDTLVSPTDYLGHKHEYEMFVVQTTPVHAQNWFASPGQEAPDLQKSSISP